MATRFLVNRTRRNVMLICFGLNRLDSFYLSQIHITISLFHFSHLSLISLSSISDLSFSLIFLFLSLSLSLSHLFPQRQIKPHQYNNIGRHQRELGQRDPRLLPAAEVLHLDGVCVRREPERAERLARLLVLEAEQPLEVLRRRLLGSQVLAGVLVEAAYPLWKHVSVGLSADLNQSILYEDE